MLGPLLATLAGLALVLLFFGRSFWAWVVPVAVLAAYGLTTAPEQMASWVVALAVAAALALFGVPGVRRRLVSRAVMRRLAGSVPRIGDTERAALESGTVWFDGDLFSGDPD